MEIVREAERGEVKYALFDFDGTISLVRGWSRCSWRPPGPNQRKK